MQRLAYLTLVFAILISLSVRAAGNSGGRKRYRLERLPSSLRGGQVLAADSSRQLVSTHFLADSQGLRVCVKMAGTPNRMADSFGFRVDFANPQTPDIEIAYNSVV